MNGVGWVSHYQRFTASVTLTTTIREGQSIQSAGGEDTEGREGLSRKKREKKWERFDACWHYQPVLSSFHGAHKANWICTSTLHWILFTAGRSTFITFFFWNTTLHICHMTHSNTHRLHNEAHLHNFISNLAHTDKSHIIHVYWFYVCVYARKCGWIRGGSHRG